MSYTRAHKISFYCLFWKTCHYLIFFEHFSQNRVPSIHGMEHDGTIFPVSCDWHACLTKFDSYLAVLQAEVGRHSTSDREWEVYRFRLDETRGFPSSSNRAKLDIVDKVRRTLMGWWVIPTRVDNMLNIYISPCNVFGYRLSLCLHEVLIIVFVMWFMYKFLVFNILVLEFSSL